MNKCIALIVSIINHGAENPTRFFIAGGLTTLIATKGKLLAASEIDRF